MVFVRVCVGVCVCDSQLTGAGQVSMGAAASWTADSLLRPGSSFFRCVKRTLYQKRKNIFVRIFLLLSLFILVIHWTSFVIFPNSAEISFQDSLGVRRGGGGMGREGEKKVKIFPHSPQPNRKSAGLIYVQTRLKMNLGSETSLKGQCKHK